MNKPKIVLVAHNLRSSHNVGSLFRTCDGLGVDELILTGYTPYPIIDNDVRLPHIANKIDKEINKTALSAQKYINWSHGPDIFIFLNRYRNQGYMLSALEQSSKSIAINDFKAPEKLVIIIGREVEGIEKEILEFVDQIVEIPMLGKKESLNVVQATAIMLYHCRLK